MLWQNIKFLDVLKDKMDKKVFLSWFIINTSINQTPYLYLYTSSDEKVIAASDVDVRVEGEMLLVVDDVTNMLRAVQVHIHLTQVVDDRQVVPSEI